MEQIQKDLSSHPENYTEWFRIVFDEVYNRLRNDATN
jgi:hypothetical protein